MKYIVKAPQKTIEVSIDLPASKSITNRLLIIQALCDTKFTINNISDSDDTEVMLQALASDGSTIDIGHAGTAMRFLTAYLAAGNSTKTLTGSARMKNRPIGVLVNALRSLGAEIDFLEKDGYPPLLIRGKSLEGGKLSIDGGVSSQYITALLLIAPTMPRGLELTLTGDIISESYIKLTTDLMQYFGIQVNRTDNCISIAPQKYVARSITVEADWSGVSYWYEIAALATEARIVVNGLQQNSLQGDAKLADLYAPLGVMTDFGQNSIVIKKTSAPQTKHFDFNFNNNPDIAQTLAVTLCMSNIPFVLDGLRTLKIKETDRIAALQTELGKYGYILAEQGREQLACANVPAPQTNYHTIEIPTYNDHRMALAFAPIALTHGQVIILKPEVVGKSYPTFWNDLRKAGFRVEEQED